jgi:4-aminobutyrate aminotransferase-like enzyme
MMMAIEFVKDPVTKEPAPEHFSHVHEYSRENGVLFGKGGVKGHLIRLLAPLCVNMKDAHKVVQVFE